MGFPAGTLTVELREAKDLSSEDWFGKNDPYVELWLDDDYKQRSSEVSNSNNPVWNETFTFNIAEGDSDKKLHLKIMDKDLFSDDKIGDCKINIEEVIEEGQVFEDWVSLPALLGLSSNGEVLVSISFEPSE
ncbi:C2 domain-containing protein [Zychaea mexicana]|uniref:C2 domain-containing protein n=1 Tax=Zychaea mexicana TaxID=64656 RepID=UPI0022FDBC34|nr:C2 domain-containing protein [Zychaea mexicana]KAI9499620.1 C2 domain-containing protein [Zychaea mexicana]